MLLKAAAAFGIAATLLGTGPFARNARLQQVAAELAAAQPQARLAVQADALFQSGLPHPAGANNRESR